MSDSERELTKIVIFGTGGCGNNAIDRMIQDKVENVHFVAVNTDKAQLDKCLAERTVQIGKDLTHGFGCGADPVKGEESANEQKDELRAEMEDADLVIVTCGMGGGTGTGSAPIIAKLAKEKGILTIGVVTKPFGFEGRRKKMVAEEGIEKLRGNVDTLIVVPNDKLIEILPSDIDMADAFHEADQVLLQCVQAITSLVSNTFLVNVDFADVCTVMRDQGESVIGVGYGKGMNRCIDAMEQATNSPLLDKSIQGAKNGLIYFGGNVPMKSFYDAVDTFTSQLADDAVVITGLNPSKDTEHTDEATCIVICTGVGKSNTVENTETVTPPPAFRPSFTQSYEAFKQNRANTTDEKQPVQKPAQPARPSFMQARTMNEGFKNAQYQKATERTEQYKSAVLNRNNEADSAEQAKKPYPSPAGFQSVSMPSRQNTKVTKNDYDVIVPSFVSKKKDK
ncbi:MAG: cell division protein FtsZ [Lachnospiraceae bacterium]|nr:cell division protein FtsZ [Lachnospiraceae bacterium]